MEEIYNLLSDENIEEVAKGNRQIALKLDKVGIFAGKSDTYMGFADTLKSFRQELDKYSCPEGLLASEQSFKSLSSEVDFDCRQEDLLSSEDYEVAANITADLYDFENRWVPGFFAKIKNPLVAGTAYTKSDIPWGLFVVSSASKNKRLSLAKSDELIAHEICHMSRYGLESVVFEETFAYQTSASEFRKKWGGIVYSDRDTLGIMSLSCLLMLSTIFAKQLPFIYGLPFYLYAMNALLCLSIFFIIRQKKNLRILNYCSAALLAYCPDPMAILFRMTDNEIYSFNKKIRRGDFLDKVSLLKLIESPVRRDILDTLLCR